jgi:hypothetical protein
VATFLLSGAFVTLFDRFLEFREAFHHLREGIARFILTAVVTFPSNGCFRTKTLL